MWKLAGTLIVVLIAGVGSAATTGPAAYRPDWSAIARQMIGHSLELAPGERVLIAHDPGRDPAFIAALRSEILRAGGIVSGEIAWPGAADGYGAGVIRIAIGDNWESGGTLRTSDRSDAWLFVTDGTLSAGKARLIDSGALR